MTIPSIEGRSNTRVTHQRPLNKAQTFPSVLHPAQKISDEFNVNTIAAQLRNSGTWNSALQTLVPHLLVEQNVLLAGRTLIIVDETRRPIASFNSMHPVEDLSERQLATAIRLCAHEDGRFSAIVAHEERPTLADGDSFFRAILAAAARCDAPPVTDDQVQALRATLALQLMNSPQILERAWATTTADIASDDIDAMPFDDAVQAWTAALAKQRREQLDAFALPSFHTLAHGTAAALKDAFLSPASNWWKWGAGQQQTGVPSDSSVVEHGQRFALKPPGFLASLIALALDIAPPSRQHHVAGGIASPLNHEGLRHYLAQTARSSQAMSSAYAFYEKPSPAEEMIGKIRDQLLQGWSDTTLTAAPPLLPLVPAGQTLPVADAQTRSFNQHLTNIDRKVTTLLANLLPWTGVAADAALAPKETEGPDYEIEIERALMWAGQSQREKITLAYHSILDPAAFIDDYIEANIRTYELEHSVSLGLSASSNITVTHIPSRFVNRYLPNKDEDYTHTPYPLREIVTRRYRDELGAKTIVTAEEHAPLLEWLRRNDLQELMEKELSGYRASPRRVDAMKSLYTDMVLARTINYLADSEHPTPYCTAIEDFYVGKLQAKEVQFHGVTLSGVFLIPFQAGGLLFSVDDDTYFEIGTRTHTYYREGSLACENVPDFPDSGAFKQWVLEKLALYSWLDLSARSDAFSYTAARSDGQRWFVAGVTSHDGPLHPFTFTASVGKEDLIERLFAAHMQRVASDIDTLVFTQWEENVEQALDMAKSLGLLLTIAVSAVASGSSMRQLALLLGATATDMGMNLALTAIQSHIADNPNKSVAYWKQALASSIVSALGGTVSALPLARNALASIYSPERIRMAIQLYKHARRIISQSPMRWPARVRWPDLGNAAKIDLLKRSSMSSAAARELTKMVGRTALEQSVSHGFNVDINGEPIDVRAWGEFDLELPRVIHRIVIDLKCVNDALLHIEHVFSNEFPAARHSLMGDPRREAARWIIGRSDPAALNVDDFADVLRRHTSATLTDLDTVDAIHMDVYRPAAGQTFRPYRAASGPIFASSEIARAAFGRVLTTIADAPRARQSDLLFAATMRLHPYGDGNGRVARTLYALAEIRHGHGWFKSLSLDGEQNLSGLPAAIDTQVDWHAQEERLLENNADIETSDSLGIDLQAQHDVSEAGPGTPRFSFSEIGALMNRIRALPTTRAYVTHAAGRSFEAANTMMVFLRHEGYEVGLRKIGIWTGTHRPATLYYVAYAKKPEGRLIVDLTAGQFDSRFTWPLIAQETNWQEVFLNLEVNRNTIIRYKDHDSVRRPSVYEQISFSDASYNSLRPLVEEPIWYRVPLANALRRAQSIVESNGILRAYLAQDASCLAVANGVTTELRAQGIPYEVIGTYIWRSPHERWPENHFAVKAQIDDITIMIDPTTSRFTGGKHFYGELREWKRLSQVSLPQATVRGRYFRSTEQAEMVFSVKSPEPMYAQQGPGQLMLRSLWYDDSLKARALAEFNAMKQVVSLGRRGSNSGLAGVTPEDIGQLFSASYEQTASVLGIRSRRTLMSVMRKPSLERGRQFQTWLNYLSRMEVQEFLSVEEKRGTYDVLRGLIDDDLVSHPDARRINQLQLLKVEIAVQRSRLDQF